LEFAHAITRSATVYRGNPFQIEVAIGYGGQLEAEGQVTLARFANRVPLLYQQGACAITKSLGDVNWRSYGLQQSGNNMPTGPAIIIVHMASVWAPFTSESKDAVAHYPEIVKEIKLALQESGRHLQRYVSRKQKAKLELKKREMFKNYSMELANSLSEITKVKEEDILKDLLELSKEIAGTLLKAEEEITEEEEEKEGGEK